MNESPKPAEYRPLCPHCETILDEVKYIDYGEIRMVFHPACGKTL